VTTETISTKAPPAAVRAKPTRSRLGDRVFDVCVRSLFPVILALGAGAILLLALGRNPVSFYQDIWLGGVSGGGWDAWQDSAIRMAPLLLIAAGLTVIFRANIWNLGYNGQFLLGAALVTGYGPSLTNNVSLPVAMLLLVLMAGAAGAVWTIVPAVLKARYGTNEIITTLMLNYLGGLLIAYLIYDSGSFWRDLSSASAKVFPTGKHLEGPALWPVLEIPGTGVAAPLGFLAGALLAVVVWLLFRSTTAGFQARGVGGSPASAGVGGDGGHGQHALRGCQGRPRRARRESRLHP